MTTSPTPRVSGSSPEGLQTTLAHPVAGIADDAGVESPPDPNLETTWVADTHRVDLRTGPPDVFEDLSTVDFLTLRWRDVGRPYQVPASSSWRREWESEQGAAMPVAVQWEQFNRNFHTLFLSNADDAAAARRRFFSSAARARLSAARAAAGELVRLHLWNYVHRVEDAVWDPRGKRALFQDLDLKKPRVLFLGAADGYEAMQLLAQYPGGAAVLVDYDDFCRTDRFGKFPSAYPFLGQDRGTGSWTTYRREDFDIEFEVADIRDLGYGRESDVVLSVGLIEHFPDAHKAEVFDFHRRFLKPGGLAIMSTPRRQLRSRAFYFLMADLMNYGYRELMDPYQMGLYAWENGFEILRAGTIKAHNGIVARAR